jgi:hypothetical protein
MLAAELRRSNSCQRIVPLRNSSPSEYGAGEICVGQILSRSATIASSCSAEAFIVRSWTLLIFTTTNDIPNVR